MQEQNINIDINGSMINMSVLFDWTPGIDGITTGPAENCEQPEDERIDIIAAKIDNQYVPQSLLSVLENDIREGIQNLKEAA